MRRIYFVLILVWGCFTRPAFSEESKANPNLSIYADFGAGLGWPLKDHVDNMALAANINLNISISNYQATFGIQRVMYHASLRNNRNRYYLVGRQFSLHKNRKATTSIGLSENRYRYESFAPDPVSLDNPNYGFHFQSQYFIHAKQAIGIGLVFDADINKYFPYFLVSVNLFLGAWSL